MKKMPEDFFKKKLSDEQYQILRMGATEAPFSSDLLKNHSKGMFTCAACGNELFSSETKFDSGTGWPSFDNPVNLEKIELIVDNSHGMQRTEVRCKNCHSHLGHLFNDGPTANKNRYCINGACLLFKPKS